MEEILNRWREDLLLRNRSPHTVRNYLSDVRQFLDCAKEKEFDPLNLDRTTARLYLAFLGAKYTKHSSIMRKRDSVKQFYRFMHDSHLVPRNPFMLLDRLKVQRDLPKFLTQNEAATLLDTIRPNPDLEKHQFGRNMTDRSHEAAFLAIRDRALLEVLYGTGTRSQETANLLWRDVDFKTGFIRVNQGKGRKDRIIPITETAMTALWEYGHAYREHFDMEPAGKNPIFQSRRRMAITTRSIQRAVNLRLKLAGIETKMSTHGLRHSFATHMMQCGADILSIAECLGHASLSNTQKYTHIALVDVLASYQKAHPRA